MFCRTVPTLATPHEAQPAVAMSMHGMLATQGEVVCCGELAASNRHGVRQMVCCVLQNMQVVCCHPLGKGPIKDLAPLTQHGVCCCLAGVEELHHLRCEQSDAMLQRHLSVIVGVAPSELLLQDPAALSGL